MDEREGRRAKRVVLSPAAEQDVAEIHLYTATAHSVEQADRYLDFIASEISLIGDGLIAGRPVEGFPNYRAIAIRWPGSRDSHRVVFLPGDEEITVVRIVHSKLGMFRRLQF